MVDVVVAAHEAHPVAVLRRLNRRSLHRLRTEHVAHVDIVRNDLVKRAQVRRAQRELTQLPVDLDA